MKTCLICQRDITPEEEDFCAARQSDKSLVCPECTELIRSGHTDTRRKLENARKVF